MGCKGSRVQISALRPAKKHIDISAFGPVFSPPQNYLKTGVVRHATLDADHNSAKPFIRCAAPTRYHHKLRAEGHPCVDLPSMSSVNAPGAAAARPGSPWLCEYLRFSALWTEPSDAAARLKWDAVVGRPPEQREEQPRIGTIREVGPVGDGLAGLELRLSPGRADWLLSPALPPDVQLTTLPNLGGIEDVLEGFRGLVFARAAAAYEAPRFALGAVVLHPADRDASYAELAQLVPQMKGHLAGASDFIFQINRPRRSRVIPDVLINRLTRWTSVSFASVRVSLSSQGEVTQRPAQPLSATRVEIDVSTAADRQTPIPEPARAPLFNELATIMIEIVYAGDVP